jgi:hypothetical protein
MSAWVAGLALGSLFLFCAAFAAFKYPLLFLAPLRAVLGVCCGTSNNNNNNNDDDDTQSESTNRKGRETHLCHTSRASKDTSVVTSSRVLGRGRTTTERCSSNNPVYSKTLLKTREDANSKSASVSASSASVEIDMVLTQALQTMNQTQQREMFRRTQLLIREVREGEEEEEKKEEKEEVHIRTVTQSKHIQI